MKRLIAVFIALVAMLPGATKVNLIDVRPLANGPSVPYLAAFSPSAGWIPVIPDPGGSIVLDTSGAVGILRAVGSAAALTDVEDDFTMAGNGVFTTSQNPRGIVHVFRNGVLQRGANVDYTTTGTGPVQVNLSGAAQGDLVALLYQK